MASYLSRPPGPVSDRTLLLGQPKKIDPTPVAPRTCSACFFRHIIRVSSSRHLLRRALLSSCPSANTVKSHSSWTCGSRLCYNCPGKFWGVRQLCLGAGVSSCWVAIAQGNLLKGQRGVMRLMLTVLSLVTSSLTPGSVPGDHGGRFWYRCPSERSVGNRYGAAEWRVAVRFSFPSGAQKSGDRFLGTPAKLARTCAIESAMEFHRASAPVGAVRQTGAAVRASNFRNPTAIIAADSIL